MTALHRACQQTNAAFVELLLKHDLNVDEQDVFERCPLALAAWRNNSAGVAFLLNRGANREVRDIFGATPLFRAVQYAAADAANVLLLRGANLMPRDHESQTILHRAALSRDTTTIRLLAAQSHMLSEINVHAKDDVGKTAKERLQTAEPSAELLKEFTAMILAIEDAKKISQTSKAHHTQDEKEPDEFIDAIEYQSDVSPLSSCPVTDSEGYGTTARRKRRTRVVAPFQQASRKWAQKYRHTFRSFERYHNNASASTATLVKNSVVE